MGCGIHTHAERIEDEQWINDGTWSYVYFDPPIFDWRNYGLFGFLAGVRNYSAVPVIAEPRGLPDDISAYTKDEWETWEDDAHSASWLSLNELLAFDYDAEFVDRRITRNGDGGVTGTVEEGTRISYREFLGDSYFADLERMKAAGAERLVFWFD